MNSLYSFTREPTQNIPDFDAVTVFTFKLNNKTNSFVANKLYCSLIGCSFASTEGVILVVGERSVVDWVNNCAEQEHEFYYSCLNSTQDLIKYLDKWFNNSWTCYFPKGAHNITLRRENEHSPVEVASNEMVFMPVEKFTTRTNIPADNQQKDSVAISSTNNTNYVEKWSEQDSAATYCWGGGILGVICLVLLIVGLCLNIPALSILGGIGTLVSIAPIAYGAYLYNRLKGNKNGR